MNPTKTKRLRPTFDALDDRCLLAGGVKASLLGGVLSIRGTAAGDVITVNVNARAAARPGRVPAGIVAVSGIRQTFRIPQVRQIVVNANAGDDTITLNTRGPVSIPARIDGGAGTDIINGLPEVTIHDQSSPSPPPVSSLVQQIVDLTNQERQTAGLSPVRISEQLTAAAQLQSDNMARLDTLSHELPGVDGATLESRAARVGYSYSLLGENIAYNYPDAEALVHGWVSSPGHRANLLNAEYTQIGVGVATNRSGQPYYAQVFGRPR